MRLKLAFIAFMLAITSISHAETISDFPKLTDCQDKIILIAPVFSQVTCLQLPKNNKTDQNHKILLDKIEELNALGWNGFNYQHIMKPKNHDYYSDGTHYQLLRQKSKITQSKQPCFESMTLRVLDKLAVKPFTKQEYRNDLLGGDILFIGQTTLQPCKII